VSFITDNMVGILVAAGDTSAYSGWGRTISLDTLLDPEGVFPRPLGCIQGNGEPPILAIISNSRESSPSWEGVSRNDVGKYPRFVGVARFGALLGLQLLLSILAPDASPTSQSWEGCAVAADTVDPGPTQVLLR